MGLKIFWTVFSKRELQKIFVYYKETTSIRVTRKLVFEITHAVLKLQNQPNIGQREELLLDSPEEFRYLVYKNYKIFYWHNIEKDRIEITDIFDARQNPVKIERNK